VVLRKNKKSKIKISLSFILIFIFFISISAVNSLAQMQSILIDIEPTDVNENDYFTVSAYIINESEEIEMLTNVNITFNDQLYTITEQGDNYEIEIKAPLVDEDTPILIYASKEGYLPGYEAVYVKNTGEKVLKVDAKDLVISAGDIFYVTVYEDGKQDQPVEGATVYISNQWDNVETTNEKGIAFLKAPDKGFEEIRVIASKEGYVSDSIYIRINLKEDLLTLIINNKYFMVFIAILALLFSILFVHLRQKKNVYNRAKEISNKKTIDKYTSESDTSSDKNRFESQGFIGPSIRVNQGKDSKVEEIRISRPRKEKEIVDVKTQKDETQDIIDKKKTQRREYDWFEGVDEIRYEIDKLTGEIDEEGIDKWFEGVDDIKKKIDEKMKKKKQNQEENNK
jgi:hypothetical protein